MDFKNEFRSKKERFEASLETFLPKEEGEAKVLMEAFSYSLLAGGKRLRPIFLLEFFESFFEKKEKTFEDTKCCGFGDSCASSERNGASFYDIMRKNAEAFACALEMIHTYSLVHDDLPAMDNDLLRRGKPTTHAKFGHAEGILAGDALLNEAFNTVMARIAAYANDPIVCTRLAKAASLMFENSGMNGMIAGQVIDTEGLPSDTDISLLFKMYELKTSCLLRAAMCGGAVLGGADDEEIKKISEIARLVGLSFQIKDDILDVTSTEAELGKPIGSDAENKKITSVTLLSLEKAQELVEEYTDNAVSIYDSLEISNSFLKELILSLTDRRS